MPTTQSKPWRKTGHPNTQALRPEIDRLATGQFDSSDRQKQIVSVLARIIAAERGFRAKDASTEWPAVRTSAKRKGYVAGVIAFCPGRKPVDH